jgi:DtxR family Mn-dependent transcriptional regulator
LYLTQELDYPLHEVHAEAERLEHAVSERFITALERKLNYPVTDPHGDPIPSAEGHIIASEQIMLTMLPLRQDARVVRLNAPNDEMLKHLVERGVMLGHDVQVLRRDPFEGPLLLRMEGESITLGHQAAACVMVEPG